MDESRYAVLVEKRGYDKRLYLHDLPFDRLVEEVVVLYEDGNPFFIDGVAVTKEILDKIKIIEQAATFAPQFTRLHQHLDFPKDDRASVRRSPLNGKTLSGPPLKPCHSGRSRTSSR